MIHLHNVQSALRKNFFKCFFPSIDHMSVVCILTIAICGHFFNRNHPREYFELKLTPGVCNRPGILYNLQNERNKIKLFLQCE